MGNQNKNQNHRDSCSRAGGAKSSGARNAGGTKASGARNAGGAKQLTDRRAIQWYPGHMTKAVRQMQEDVKLIDLIIELVDARVPISSRNPDIERLGAGKGRLLLLNKSDLADPEQNERWKRHYRTQGLTTVLLDSRNNHMLGTIRGAVEEACREKRARDRVRGILNRPVRAMVVGIPNVGKSTFINSYAKKSVAKTGNRPGVTKGKQWIRMGEGLELLDTPGITWPRFDDPVVGLHLAMIGSINDEILQPEALALQMLSFLQESYPGRVQERYAISDLPGDVTWAALVGDLTLLDDDVDMETKRLYGLLAAVGEARGCLKKGARIDLEKAARYVVDDFRSGAFGRITLEQAKVETARDALEGAVDAEQTE